MEKNRVDIPMFTYLEIYASNNNIDYHFLEVNMFQKGQVWKTTSNKTIVSNHSPLKEVTITAQNVDIIASPFKTLNLKDDEGRTVTLKDCKNLQQQNNFTNQILRTLSSQLDKIEDKLEDYQISRQIVAHFLDRNLDKNRQIFKPAEVGNQTLKLSNNNNNDLIQILTKKIEQLDLSNKASTSNTKFVNVITKIISENVDQIQNMFEKPQINRIAHKYKQQTKTRNYYPIPTLPDLQYKERNQIVQSKYDGDAIYEWNIDGVSDHQVLNIFQEMIMASTAYKSRGNSDNLICVHLVVGFTSQLKGWRDNALIEEEKIFIQTSLDKRRNQSSVHTLIFAITKTLPWRSNCFPSSYLKNPSKHHM